MWHSWVILAQCAVLLWSPPGVASAEPSQVFHESVEVSRPAIYPTWRQCRFLDANGVRLAIPITISDLRVHARGRDGREVDLTASSRIVRSVKPIALTVVVDTSGSMRGTAPAIAEFVRECILALGPEDRIRIITFNSVTAWNDFSKAQDYRRSSLTRHLHGLAQRQPDSAEWSCLVDALPVPVRGESESQWVRRLDERVLATRCPARDWDRAVRASIDSYLMRAFRSTGATFGDDAVEETLRGLMRRVGTFLPAYDANPGIVVFTDDARSVAFGKQGEAILRVLLVQTWFVQAKGVGIGHAPGISRVASLREEGASDLARTIVMDLRDVYDVEVDAPNVDHLAPGAIRINSERDPKVEAVFPSEALPPREVLAAVADDESSESLERREILRRLSAASPSARDVIREIMGEAVAGP